MEYKQLTASIISDPNTLHQAKILLYKYYIEALKWEIPLDNCSGLKIQGKDSQAQIIDDYDDHSAWFSSVNEYGNVLACVRLCKNDSNGVLEIERYNTAKKQLQSILNLKAKLNIVELNREATLFPLANNQAHGLLLLKAVFYYCLKYRHSILTTTNITEWLKLYDSLLFPRLRNSQFKYSENDPAPVEVYFAKTDAIAKMLNKINNLLKNSELALCQD